MKFKYKLIIFIILLIFTTPITNATLSLRPEEGKAIKEANQKLIKSLNIKISSYGDTDSINYGQIYENEEREGDTSLLILLHDEYREFRYRNGLDYLENPLIKPLLEYIKNNHKKVIILIPESNYFSDWLGYTNLNTPENKLHISITKQLQILYKVGEYKNPIVEPPIQKVIELAQIIINKYKIPLNKVYIAGISMGGIGCYYMLANYPDYFNKALIFGSDLPKEYIEKIKGKLFVVQGENDGPSKYQTKKDKLFLIDFLNNPKIDIRLYNNISKNSSNNGKKSFTDNPIYYKSDQITYKVIAGVSSREIFINSEIPDYLQYFEWLFNGVEVDDADDEDENEKDKI